MLFRLAQGQPRIAIFGRGPPLSFVDSAVARKLTPPPRLPDAIHNFSLPLHAPPSHYSIAANPTHSYASDAFRSFV